MKIDAQNLAAAPQDDYEEDDGPPVGLAELLTWIGQAKLMVAGMTVAAALAAIWLAR